MVTLQEFADLFSKLVSTAKAGQTVPYSAAAPVVRLDMENPPDRDEMGHLLGYISSAEAKNGRPLLSSVVTFKDGTGVGQGFYSLGKELRLVRPGEDEITFWIRELKMTHDFWRGLPARS